jgi:hypothetical protein
VTDDLDRLMRDVFYRPEEDRSWAMNRYRSLSQPQLKQLRVARIECASDHRRLLDVWEENDGSRYYFRSRYVLSAGVNEATSNESGRRRNTEDGDRKWRGDAGPVEPDSTFLLTCQHHLNRLVLVDALASARRRKPLRLVLELGGSLVDVSDRR